MLKAKDDAHTKSLDVLTINANTELQSEKSKAVRLELELVKVKDDITRLETSADTAEERHIAVLKAKDDTHIKSLEVLTKNANAELQSEKSKTEKLELDLNAAKQELVKLETNHTAALLAKDDVHTKSLDEEKTLTKNANAELQSEKSLSTALLEGHSIPTTTTLLRRLMQLSLSLLPGQGGGLGGSGLVTGEVFTPLSEDDEQQHTMGPPSLVQQQRGKQRAHWIIRHSGSKHLTRVLFQFFPVDVIVSLKDDIGTTYTSYVHVADRNKCRATSFEHALISAECVAFFKIYDVAKSTMQLSCHYKKIAEGVKSVHKNLIIEFADPSINFGIFIAMFIK